jgi:hypothetical protein
MFKASPLCRTLRHFTNLIVPVAMSLVSLSSGYPLAICWVLRVGRQPVLILVFARVVSPLRHTVVSCTLHRSALLSLRFYWLSYFCYRLCYSRVSETVGSDKLNHFCSERFMNFIRTAGTSEMKQNKVETKKDCVRAF